MEKLVLENVYKIFVPLFVAPNIGTTILYGFRSLSTVLNSTENGRIQGFFEAFEWFSSTFHGRFYFQERSLNSSTFKPVRTLLMWYSKKLLNG